MMDVLVSIGVNVSRKIRRVMDSESICGMVLPDVRFGTFDVFLQQWNERFNLELFGFGDNIFDQTI